MAKKFRELLEEPARIIKPANPEIVARLKAKDDLTKFMAKGTRLEFIRDGISLEYIFKHKGRWVIDTTHAAQRIVERGVFSIKEMEFFFRKMIEKYMSMGSKYTSLNNPEFLFFSKSLNQGMIVAYRKDFKKIDNQKHFVIITFFPRGSKRTKQGTETILLEAYTYGTSPVYSDEFVRYISELRCNHGKEYECFTEAGYGDTDYIPECIKIKGCPEFDIIFCEGKLFQIANYHVIECD